MLFRIALENNSEGRSVAWALDLPGCFGYGPDGSTAIMDMARAIPNYVAWLDRHATPLWFDAGAIDIRLVDTWDVYHINERLEPDDDGIEINAWFRDDWRPLSQADVDLRARLLELTRADLLELARDTRPDQMDVKLDGERWSIAGILKHVANADWWYLSRLGLVSAPREALPAAPLERLAYTRARLIAALPSLVEAKQVVGIDGEFWSPRKLLRRSLWHERDHTGHIARLLASM